jgi:hypothetical protein
MAKKTAKKAAKKNGTLGVMLLTADRKASLGTMRIDPKDMGNVVNAIKKYAKGTTGAFMK